MRSRKELIIEAATEKAEQSPFMNVYSADDVLIAAGMNEINILEIEGLNQNLRKNVVTYVDRWLEEERNGKRANDNN